MIAILRVTLVAAFLCSSLPAVTEGQRVPIDTLLRRIDLLERTTTDLQRRVRELEAVISRQPSREQPVSTSVRWEDLQNWRRLRREMTMDEVRAVLGEPERVETIGGLRTTWRWGFYSNANVYFDGRSDRLDGWSEPDRDGLSRDAHKP